MFRIGSLIIVMFFTGCVFNRDQNAGYDPNKVYEIVVLDNRSGKEKETFLAKGKDIKYDVISQEVSFKTTSGQRKSVKSSFSIGEQ